MNPKEYFAEMRQNQAAKVKDCWERLKDTDAYQRRSKTFRLYMLCLELDMTMPTVTACIKLLGIEV